MPPPSGDSSGQPILTGTSGRNQLQGTSADETLMGLGNNGVMKGSGGDDVLWGGRGSNVFLFTNPDDVVVIADWESKDVIRLETSDYAALNGDVRRANLVTGTSARDGNDFMIHDRASGKLWYDADGSGLGSGSAILIAVIEDALLDPWDFTFV